MKQFFMVGCGGFLGSIARYAFGGFVLHHSINWRFPLSTFAVNLVGCFAIGLLSAVVEKHNVWSPETRLFLFTGVLGGFTTFSAFSYEAVFLFRRAEPLIAIAYAMLSVVCGFAAVWLGFKLLSGGDSV
ncbi:MAG: fluoride exporter [Chthoniobacter sp.]|jgi:CrcB protein|nr:fluoride exporter [Chthoniobacter sp.]